MKRSAIALVLMTAASLLWSEAYSEVSGLFGIDPNAGQNSFFTLIIPGGGKYEGMATAHTAVSLDGGYLEANPAGGSFLPRTILSFSHVDWIADSALESITYAFRPDRNENFGLGFNGKFLHVPFTGYNAWGSQYTSSGTTAAGWYTEFVATAAISYNFLRNFYFGGISVGTALKVGYRGVSASLAPNQNALSLMGDIGVMTRFNFLKPYASRDMNFAVGVTLKNIGVEFIDTPDPLPSYASVGFSYKPLRPLTLAVDFNLPFNLNGMPAESVGLATGVNVDITEFLSTHAGVLIKTGKPRFSIGADLRLKDFTLVANYTLDLATRLEVFDRMSVAVKLNFGMVRQLIVKDDVQNLYLEGLDAYAKGELEKAIRFWEAGIVLDPSFKPAQEMLDMAMKSLELENKLKDTLIE